MARDIESKKRKASIPEHSAEKLKKVKKDALAAPEKKRKASEETAPISVKKTKTPKALTTEEPLTSRKKVKEAAAELNGKKSTTDAKISANIIGKSTTKAKIEDLKSVEPSDEDVISSGDKDEDESALDFDDQTEALLKGFESEGDEEDDKKEGGLEDGQTVPTVKLSKKDKKAIKIAAEAKKSEKPGVVYVGRIPHGFYEKEMREYFKQFGNILQLRLSRNPKTGASRHFAFIQFESGTVAEIVSKAMDNYLLFNHILKVKLVSEEQVHSDLFKGANKRFKKVPWNKIQGRLLEQGASEETWAARIEKAEKKRQEKAEKLKDIGYEFEAPKIKSVKGIAKPASATEEIKAIEAAPVEEGLKAVEATPAEESKSKKKKEKKAKKGAEPETTEPEVVAESVPAEISAPIAGQDSKPKKRVKKANKGVVA
ncbi:hypothetical protein B0O99DRAFT_620577 [Bisporella sp. PMI_857]|nr:hypothetical protein B0O99DRAFT_620577 [Bisporella sp. PMI_857]